MVELKLKRMTTEEKIEAFKAAHVTHTRYRGPGVPFPQGVLVYERRPESPTGVLLLLTFTLEEAELPEVQALLRGGLSPLSPAEPR